MAHLLQALVAPGDPAEPTLPMTLSNPPLSPVLRAGFLLAVVACATATAGGVEEPFETPATTWTIGDSDVTHRVVSHARSTEGPHRGKGCERIVIDAASGTTLRWELPLQPARVIDEWRAALWVRADRPDIRLSARIILPAFRSSRTGTAVAVLVPGDVSRGADRWEPLGVADVATALRKSLPALRAEHGPAGDLTGAVITHLVLDLYSRPGHYDVSIDDLEIEGIVPAGAVAVAVAGADPAGADPAGADPAGAVRPVAHDAAPEQFGEVVQAAAELPLPGEGLPPAPPRSASAAGPLAAPNAPLAWSSPGGVPAPPPAGPAGRLDPVSGLNRGVLEVAGQPFFPRALDHNGEPFAVIAALGFNTVRLAAPASSDQIDEARRTGLWIICPPPHLPDVDVRRPEALPMFSANWDRVLVWDMGSGLSEADVDTLAEHARRVRTCDQHAGRPLVATPDSGLRSLSRHVDMLVARRTVLGTSVELGDYFTWLRERPRLARPGTPFLATLSTELDPRTARQAAQLAGIGGRGLAVDPESLALASLATLAAGARGILFTSTRRIDGDDHESRIRSAAVRSMNLRLRVLEPWGAAGRFSTTATASDPEVRGVVLEAARARMVVAWRNVQGGQIVASHYHGDMPTETAPVTLLMNGIPEAHQAWEVTPGGLRPLRHRRVTGGVSVVLDPFRSSALVLVTGDPAVAAHVQERLREQAAATLAASRERSALLIADAVDLLARIPPLALGRLPGPAMIAAAQQDSLAADSLATSDPATAIARYERAAAIAGQVERLVWEKGVVATGSMVAGPLSTSDATLVEHWRFVEALSTTSPREELLVGGGMERIEELSGSGWRHFALKQAILRTGVEISRTQPASGRGCLVMRAEAVDPAAAPAVVETPPVWITTPPLSAPSGKLLQIEARVWVPKPVKGSVDGLLVFDSLGGPALAERVGPSAQWRRLVLYRIVPADLDGEAFTVTFALTGLGEARIDDVSVRVLDRGAGVPAMIVSNGPGREEGARSFPTPGEVLSPPNLPATDAAAPPAVSAVTATPPAASTPAAWPGMNLEWPKLPFSGPTNAPPPGPGGGRIDPFKRAGVAATVPQSTQPALGGGPGLQAAPPMQAAPPAEALSPAQTPPFPPQTIPLPGDVQPTLPP